MFESLGHVIAHHKKKVLAFFILVTIIAGGIGSQVFSRFDSGGYSDPNSDSAKVWEYLDETFKVKDPAIVFVVDGKDKSVDDPEVVASAQKIESQVRSESSGHIVTGKSTDFTEVDKLGGE